MKMFLRLLLFFLIAGLGSAYPSQSELVKPSTFRRDNGPRDHMVGIYDGTNTTIENHPYLVGILFDGDFFCTGVILSEQWIITDADCIFQFDRSDLTIVSGSSDGVNGTNHKVKKVVLHPNYVDIDYIYDYALVKIKDSFTWGSSVGNISLPSSEIKAKTQVVVAGYGEINSGVNGTSTWALKEGKMKWLANDTCSHWYTNYFGWSESKACAYNKGKTTVCTGDFGDPFVHDGVLYGIAVGGPVFYWCSEKAWPVIIADIFPVVDWIKQYTGAQIAN